MPKTGSKKKGTKRGTKGIKRGSKKNGSKSKRVHKGGSMLGSLLSKIFGSKKEQGEVNKVGSGSKKDDCVNVDSICSKNYFHIKYTGDNNKSMRCGICGTKGFSFDLENKAAVTDDKPCFHYEEELKNGNFKKTGIFKGTDKCKHCGKAICKPPMSA